MPSRFLNNITVNDEYTLPSADGTADQIITTDGAGQLSFVDQSTINAGNAEHVVIYAKNTSGSQIDKGTPVYITGTVGATDTVEIAPADAGDSAKMPAVGLLDDTLINNAFGYVITGGFMDNITTDPIDTLTPSSNDTVYVKVGGGLTLTKPTGPTGLIQNVAKVGKVSGGNAGSLIVSSILRTNDVPNLTTGKIWVGDGNTVESTVVHLDEVNERMGIGTTSPDYKLDVSGDAYIDETLNIETTISGTLTYGYSGVGAGNLVVGGLNFASFTPGVITLINQDTTISAGQDLGVLQFGGKDDTTNGYANGQIICTTASNAGTGNTGGGIFRFLLSGNTTGSGLSEKMRITNTGNVGIGTTSPGEKLEVNGSVKATASTDAYKGYIKQTITSSANEKVDNADYNLVPYNTLTTVSSDQSYNRMVAAYDGRIKKVYIRNTSGTVTADTVNFKKQVNNTTAATVYSATVANAGSAGMSAVYNFADSDFTFNEGDTFGILYQTTDSAGVAKKMAGVAINVIVEYNIT